MNSLHLQFNEDDLFLDQVFGPLPEADELLDEIESDIFSTLPKERQKVSIHYHGLRRGKKRFLIELLIDKKWISFHPGEMQLDKLHKTVILTLKVCKAKNLSYKLKDR